MTTSTEHIQCGDKTHHSTRTEVAQLVAVRVAHLLMTGYNGKPLVGDLYFLIPNGPLDSFIYLEMGSPGDRRQHEALEFEEDRLSRCTSNSYQLLSQDVGSCASSGRVARPAICSGDIHTPIMP